MASKKDNNPKQILIWLLNILATMGIAIGGWSLISMTQVQQTIVRLEERITVSQDKDTEHAKLILEITKWQHATEAQKFTIIDAHKLENQLQKEIADIKILVASQKIPEWYKNSIRDLNNKLRDGTPPPPKATNW